MEEVILVDALDNELGAMEKLAAHQQGKLHRAFSILIFNSKGELLLQQRAHTKYHSGGLWTNACCSHPRPGESAIDAGKRKLMQEMGFECDLSYSHKFLYKVALDNDLIEYEWDHVLIGYFDGIPKLNPDEAIGFRFMPLDDVKADAKANPHRYTTWFKLILEQPELSSLQTT
jgi:isopentenyl-diphosphate Delta-isomerase